MFIGDTISLSVSQAALTESFVGTDYKYDFIESGKVCCESEVNRISEMECVRNADIVCGVGGGGCMDIAKTIGNKFDKALVMIVTTASSDAPCTFMALTYTDDGARLSMNTRFPKMPGSGCRRFENHCKCTGPSAGSRYGVMRLQPGMKGKPADRIRMEFILQSLRSE